MNGIQKRFLATVTGKLYSSKKGKIVKAYLEDKGLEEWAAKAEGVDGAESVVVVLVMDLDFIPSVSRSHTFSTEAPAMRAVPFPPNLSTLMSR